MFTIYFSWLNFYIYRFIINFIYCPLNAEQKTPNKLHFWSKTTNEKQKLKKKTKSKQNPHPLLRRRRGLEQNIHVSDRSSRVINTNITANHHPLLLHIPKIALGPNHSLQIHSKKHHWATGDSPISIQPRHATCVGHIAPVGRLPHSLVEPACVQAQRANNNSSSSSSSAIGAARIWEGEVYGIVAQSVEGHHVFELEVEEDEGVVIKIC